MLPPELTLGYIGWTVKQGYQWDVLTSNALVGNTVLGGEPYTGKIYGTQVYSSNLMQVPAAGSKWEIYMGTSTAMTVGLKPTYVQVISPQMNQAGPDWALRQIVRGGWTAINAPLRAKATIHAV